MRRACFSLIRVWVSLSSVLFCASLKAGEILSLEDTTRSDWEFQQGFVRFEREGDRYVYSGSSPFHRPTDPFAPFPQQIPEEVVHEVPLQVVEAIRECVLHGARSPEKVLDRLKLTEDRILAKRDQILEQVVDPLVRGADGKMPRISKEGEALLEWAHLQPHLQRVLTGNEIQSTLQPSLRVELPGEPNIQLHSQVFSPGMLPFSVQVGEEQWLCYDPDLPELLGELLLPGSPNAQRLDLKGFSEQDLWGSGQHTLHVLAIWSPIRLEMSRVLARDLIQELPGYSQAMRRFQYQDEQLSLGNFFTGGESISIRLISKKNTILSKVHWYIPLKHGRCGSDWLQLLELLDQVEQQLGGQTWLRLWLQGREGRSFVLKTRGHSGSLQDSGLQEAKQAWQQAGLAGMPEVEMSLMGRALKSDHLPDGLEWQDERELAHIYLGPKEARMLVTELSAGENPWRPHRSFTLGVFSDRHFAVVEPDGGFELHRLGEDSDDADSP